MISRDGGNSWECNPDFSVITHPKILAFDANGFLNFDQQGLYKSSDQGSSWMQVLSEGWLSTYEMVDENRGFAITNPYGGASADPKLYLTNDGWSSSQSIAVTSLSGKLVNCIVPVTSDEIFFFEAENIYFSPDSGSTLELVQTIDFEPTHAKKVNDTWYITGRGLAKYKP
jgi:hypothetical protein